MEPNTAQPKANPVILMLIGALIFGAGIATSFFLLGSIGTSEDLEADIAGVQSDIDKLNTRLTQLQGDMKIVIDEALGIVNVSEDDDPFLGSPDAPVVIVEFSDYQCPFCRRFHVETFEALKEEFIDTGIVRFVYRDFPITSIHPNAADASLAAECADDQGMFWQMHDLLFDSQQQWETSENLYNQLLSYAVRIGLNMEEYTTCMTTQAHYQEISEDLQEGVQYGVQGTPHFFVNGRTLNGALPLSEFRKIIEAELARLGE